MTASRNVITVFGGAGFIGRHLVQELARTGATIRVATRNPAGAYFLRPGGAVGQVVPVACDINDADSIATVLDGATHSVNLVGILFEKGKSTFARIHAEAATRIAEQAAKARVRQHVHISALGASETGPSKYQRSKAAGEKGVRAAYPDATILRPSVIFGADDQFFNKFAAMARISPFLPLIGGGKTRFQPVYVGDVAAAIKRTLLDETGRTRGQTYELGGPHIYDFRELMELTLEYSGQEAALMPVPWALASIMGAFLGLLPHPPLTRDQVASLKEDNVVNPKAAGFDALGMTPTALESVVPGYLKTYRPGGRFARHAA